MVSSTNGTDGIIELHVGRKKLDPCRSLCPKLNYKGIKDLNLTPHIRTLKEDKLGNELELFDTGNAFLTKTLVVQ